MGIETDIGRDLAGIVGSLNEALWEVVKKLDDQNRILEYLVLLLAKVKKGVEGEH